MGIEKLKYHSVIVGGGGGFVVPASTPEYTYIATAKHLFFNEDTTGRGYTPIEKENGEIINITRFINSVDEINTTSIEFCIEKNINYFPHPDADIAILKVQYLPDFGNVLFEENVHNVQNYLVCGFPKKLRSNEKIEEKYTNHEIVRFITDNNTNCRVQLSNVTLGHSDIVGMSGCGLVKNDSENISLIGIQSKVPALNSNGQIDFVPVKFINEIISLNSLHPINSEYLDFDDFSSMHKDCKLHDKVFCVTFNTESQPYYLKRNIDTILLNYLNRNKNVWISGLSGIGKTFLILANIYNVSDNPIRIDLTCSSIENIDNYFEYINTEIISQCKLANESTRDSIYERISDNLCEINLQSNQMLIFVDEVPILDQEKFYNFIIGFVNISERFTNLAKGKKNINWIISTRINPENHLNNDESSLPNKQKALRNFNFKNLDLWTENELSNLLNLLKFALNFKLSAKKEKEIITLSKGQPGILKSVFERMLLENCTIDYAIELVKTENINL